MPPSRQRRATKRRGRARGRLRRAKGLPVRALILGRSSVAEVRRLQRWGPARNMQRAPEIAGRAREVDLGEGRRPSHTETADSRALTRAPTFSRIREGDCSRASGARALVRLASQGIRQGSMSSSRSRSAVGSTAPMTSCDSPPLDDKVPSVRQERCILVCGGRGFKVWAFHRHRLARPTGPRPSADGLELVSKTPSVRQRRTGPTRRGSKERPRCLKLPGWAPSVRLAPTWSRSSPPPSSFSALRHHTAAPHPSTATRARCTDQPPTRWHRRTATRQLAGRRAMRLWHLPQGRPDLVPSGAGAHRPPWATVLQAQSPGQVIIRCSWPVGSKLFMIPNPIPSTSAHTCVVRIGSWEYALQLKWKSWSFIH